MRLQDLSGFDWDDGNWQKCQKHGVSIAEIEAAFYQGGMRVFPDSAHSQTETRYIGISKTKNNKGLFVCFTLREKHQERFIRPLSVRYMHQKEVDYYEKILARS